jgi:hypothetical protein
MPQLSRSAWALMTTVAVLAGCTTATVGHPVKAPEPPPGPDGVTRALLDPGNYPTKPAPPLGNAGKEGTVVEAHRMAAAVVLPTEVDTSLLDEQLLFTTPITEAQSLVAVISDPAGAVAARRHFIVAFASARSSDVPGHGKGLLNVVMRFADPDAATAAAKEMSALPPLTGTPRTPVPIPNHPDAIASTFEVNDNTGSHVVESYAPHGIYVLYQFANSLDNVEVAANMIATTLDLQAPRIDAFAPTDPAHLADLPQDPTGVLAATLPGAKPVFDGVYEPKAALHYETNPTRAAALFDAAGVQQVSMSKTTVYAAKDPAGAQRVADQVSADLAASSARVTPAGPVPGMPTAKCFDGGPASAGGVRFICVATAGRYAYKTRSLQDADAHQQVAAQYLMLSRQ